MLAACYRWPAQDILCRMPTEGPPTQQVNVQVIDCLPTLTVTIDYQSKTPIRNPDLPCDPVRHQQEVAQQPIISLVRIEDGREVLTGNNQDVDRGLRVNVFESYRLLVLIHNLPRTFTIGYLTKETGIHTLVLSIFRLALFPVALAQFPSYL
ncbi:protein of unknown function [Candidatus Methylomirabilis oxygeniifera]|uniref:Uncharacterized protein n=1 Tax=Methylomirabilis oxygeniifera TaxID=671143 RepID=D5MHZ4_METO1|nr:protein of unknown function [Candidatus Methylomirabilis oxyfera]